VTSKLLSTHAETDADRTRGRTEMTPPAASLLSALAEEGGGGHEGIKPVLNGIIAFSILLLLLFITTRFNRDR
jgi:hypothetical protein